ncbi:response regulator [Cohnella soli]|uniref:Response regulator n=1 Tax=Cohnella soli TaxID=425005 RepID=A0ABW0HRD4_9BACL
MFNVLLVDDEPFIVDSMFNMLERSDRNELLLWKATSAPEAIEIMQENRIDILITDVRMPGMNGIELVERVKKHWRNCKVIFLSGYSDYEYLQSALRHDAFDYLLKPVDDDTILDTLQRGILEIETELQTLDVMARAELQLQKAQNLLQKEFVESLLTSQPPAANTIQSQLRELQIPLLPDRSFIMMLGRVDRWPQDYSPKDKLLMQNAVHNIVEEYLHRICRIQSFSESRYSVWLIQIDEPDSPDEDQSKIQDPAKLQWYINELLEKIQQSIRHYLRLPVSFVLSKPDVEWGQIHQAYHSMRELIQRGIGLDEEIILVEQADDMLVRFGGPEWMSQDVRKHINQLLSLLESGNGAAFRQELTRFLQLAQRSVFLDYAFQLEIFAHLSAMFLTYMNARKLTGAIANAPGLDPLAHYGKHANWPALETYFLQLTDRLLSLAEGERKDQKKEIIDQVDAYIVDNLQRNISLSHLAKRFHLSPFYLSRLFHAEKGISLSDRTKMLKISKAMELLLVDGIKIQEVALELGFDNVPYFTKFFKKNVGITPLEYKQSNNNP